MNAQSASQRTIQYGIAKVTKPARLAENQATQRALRHVNISVKTTALDHLGGGVTHSPISTHVVFSTKEKNIIHESNAYNNRKQYIMTATQ